MHSHPNPRRALAALTTVAALVALSAGATAAHADDGVPAVEKIEAEVEQLRAVVGEDASGSAQRELAPLEEVAETGRTARARLAVELTSVRTAIEARRREALFPFRPRVAMSEARIAGDGDAQLRMACSDDALKACRGIAWLTAEDGTLLEAGVFRVPAGEAKRVVLDAPGSGRRGGRRVVARAAVRDASGAVWTNSRQLSLQS